MTADPTYVPDMQWARFLKQRRTKCRNFQGMAKGVCKAGISFSDLEQSALSVCQGAAPCEKYLPYTEEELRELFEEDERHIAMLTKGRSPCCGEPMDTSQVIKSGRHQGHGPRFCSKCGKLAFMV